MRSALGESLTRGVGDTSNVHLMPQWQYLIMDQLFKWLGTSYHRYDAGLFPRGIGRLGVSCNLGFFWSSQGGMFIKRVSPDLGPGLTLFHDVQKVT
jgi:hypothetical protein